MRAILKCNIEPIHETIRYDAETGAMIEPPTDAIPPTAYKPLPEPQPDQAFGVRRQLETALANDLRLALRKLQAHEELFPTEMKFPKRPGILLLPRSVIGKHRRHVPITPLRKQLTSHCRDTINLEPEADIVDLRFQDRNKLNLIVSAPELSSETAAIRKVLGWYSIHDVPAPSEERFVEDVQKVVAIDRKRKIKAKPAMRQLFAITIGNMQTTPKLTTRKQMELAALQAIDDVYGIEHPITLQAWDYIEPQGQSASLHLNAA